MSNYITIVEKTAITGDKGTTKVFTMLKQFEYTDITTTEEVYNKRYGKRYFNVECDGEVFSIPENVCVEEREQRSCLDQMSPSERIRKFEGRDAFDGADLDKMYLAATGIDLKKTRGISTNGSTELGKRLNPDDYGS